MSTKLTKGEAAIIQMALISFIEISEQGLAEEPFTLEAKRFITEMLESAKSAKEKMIKLIGHELKLDPMTPDEEKEYLLF